MTSITELAIVIFIAALFGVIAKVFRQPLILAYLATGVVVGSVPILGFLNISRLTLFSDLGIMFLLFLVGLQINYTSLRLVGRSSVIIGIGQILFTFGIGYFIIRALGFPFIESLYVSTALTFSSTIIILKLLSDRRDLNSLYGKISVGFLLVQDVVAVLLLVFLSGIGSNGTDSLPFLGALIALGKGAIFFTAMILLGRKVLPKIFDRAARSEEFLFLISLAWLFLVVAVASRLGFSIEIAGFLAGLALANSAERFQIASRIGPLRDFFIFLFFVILGSSVAFSDLGGHALAVGLLSLFVLVGNPLIVLILMGLMGYRRRTSFFAGITVAQISEFSLILMALGMKLGHVGSAAVSVVTAVGVATILLSSYAIVHAESLYRWLSSFLKLFEKKKTHEVLVPSEGFLKPIVLIGCHRVGESILDHLSPHETLVIDFDPDVMELIRRRGFECLFGDIRDKDIFLLANISSAKLVISTSPDINDNIALLEGLRDVSPRPKTILRAETEAGLRLLYEYGADYVIFPHLTSGQYLGKTIAIDPEIPVLQDLKENDLKLLERARRA